MSSDHWKTVSTVRVNGGEGAGPAGCAVLAVPHGALTEGLHGMLATCFDSVVVVADERSLLACVESLHPDLVVLDLGLVPGGSIGLTARLRGRYPGQRILLLVDDDDAELARAAGAAGADGCLLLGAVGLDLLPAVEELLAGRKALWSDGAWAGALRGGKPPGRSSGRTADRNGEE